jgi:hypothetical protein
MMDALLDGEPCGRACALHAFLRSTVSEVPGVTGQLSRGFEFQGAILHK